MQCKRFPLQKPNSPAWATWSSLGSAPESSFLLVCGVTSTTAFWSSEQGAAIASGIARPAFMKPSSAPKPAGGFSSHRSCQSFVLPVGWISLRQGLWTLQWRERLHHHRSLKKNILKITDLKHHWAKTFLVLHPCLFVSHMPIPPYTCSGSE